MGRKFPRLHREISIARVGDRQAKGLAPVQDDIHESCQVLMSAIAEQKVPLGGRCDGEAQCAVV